jgi:hypothetical protein
MGSGLLEYDEPPEALLRRCDETIVAIRRAHDESDPDC